MSDSGNGLSRDAQGLSTGFETAGSFRAVTMVSPLHQRFPMKRLLIADDQRDVLTALELPFKAEGISATTVTSPEAIVASVQGERFDAVLMDLNYTRDTTSGEEGLDVLTRLAAIPGAPPVIVMTAWGSIELAVEAMSAGPGTS